MKTNQKDHTLFCLHTDNSLENTGDFCLDTLQGQP